MTPAQKQIETMRRQYLRIVADHDALVKQATERLEKARQIRNESVAWALLQLGKAIALENELPK